MADLTPSSGSGDSLHISSNKKVEREKVFYVPHFFKQMDPFEDRNPTEEEFDFCIDIDHLYQ